MSNVASRESRPHFRTNTGYSGRRPAPEITCSGCGGSSGHCTCLTDWRLYRQTMPHVRRVLESGKGLGQAVPIVWLAARKQSREALAQLLEQDEQREREREAFRAFFRTMRAEPHRKYSAARDREILDHLLGDFARGGDRSLVAVAAKWGRPVDYVRDLRDRCLIALRRWPKAKPATSAAARRAA